MAMKPQCIQAVNQAAGRDLSAAERQGIDDRLNATMRRLAAAEPNWQAKSTAQRVEEAAVAALADIQREAARKVANVQRQAVATAQIQGRIQTLSDAYQGGQTRGLVEEINNTSHYADAVKRESVSNLVDLVEATSSGQGASMVRRVAMFLFGAENHAMTKDLVSEIFAKGQAGTGNALAKSGAEAWLKVIENLRERFNAAGGDVGRLDYGYIPMAHDAARIRDAGRGLLNRAPTLAEAKDAWTAGVLPKLDRRRYVREDGSRMSDAEVTDFLRAAFDTLVSDGMNKQTPGAFKGTGARANRGSESRLIHFKDGEAYLAYNREFGSGSMYDAMTSHIGAMARDIALVERWGPNPNQQFRLQSDLAMMADGGIKRIGGVKPQAYWDIVSGVTGSPDSARIAAVGMHSRNIQTMGKLAGAVISSITDLASIMVTANYNKLPYFDLLRNTMMMATKEGREFATAHGVIAESMINDMNRFQAEHIANNWSGRLANSTMRLSLMNAWTDTMRRGFSVTMQQGLGRISKTAWADLTEWDRSHLTRKGITEDDWAVVNQAQLTHYKGADYLTPEAIAAADISAARPSDLQAVRDKIEALTTELRARNQQETEWISNRIDRFDSARDSMNKRVKELLARKTKKDDEAAKAIQARANALDAQLDAAKVEAKTEAEYNKLFTKADIDAFESGLKSAASDLNKASSKAVSAADRAGEKFGRRRQRIEAKMREIEKRMTGGDADEKRLQQIAQKAAEVERAALERDIEEAFKAYPKDEREAFRAAVDSISDVRKSANQGMASAEQIGRRIGEQKGRIERRIKELEKQISKAERETRSEVNEAAKEAQKKAAKMAEELAEFVKRSKDRQARRAAVVSRLESEIDPSIKAESVRIQNEVSAKILGLITDESEYAVINPDLTTKAWSTGGLQAGTVKGELARSVMQFKSFPVAMISRHWRRMLETPQGLDGAPVLANKAAYTAAMLITTTLLGAVVFQVKQMLTGKDPVDMTTPKFWTRAAAQGGGAGFVGDMILGDTTQDRSMMDSLGRMFLGPTFNSAADLYALTKGNIDEKLAGKDTHAAAEAIKFTRSHLPYVNLWYGKAALDHMIMHGVQENLSPGYLARQKQRAYKEWKQGFWWEPGEALPDRAPQLGGR